MALTRSSRVLTDFALSSGMVMLKFSSMEKSTLRASRESTPTSVRGVSDLRAPSGMVFCSLMMERTFSAISSRVIGDIIAAVHLRNVLRDRFWVVYLVWILLCAGLFAATRDMEDPSRRSDRISNLNAGIRATRLLRSAFPGQFTGHVVTHIASSRSGELGPEARWVVLFDSPSRPGLEGAVVVELRARDGSLIRIREAVVKSDELF